MLKPTPQVKRSDPESARAVTVRTLFDAEETPLLRYAFSLVGRREVAEEIVQEVFLELHRRWDEVQTPRAWLFRCVRNRACNHLRKHGREVLRGDEENGSMTNLEEDQVEALVLRSEATVVLRAMLEDLEKVDRQLVTLKYFDGLSYCDISAKTGLSVSNVGYRLHHILKQLANQLRRRGLDDFS